MLMEKDLLIIGGGPAGSGAGVYSARKKLDTVLVTREYGGQSIVSPAIQNWIGIPSISGVDLADSFRKHLEVYEGDSLELKLTSVLSVEEVDDRFITKLENGDEISSKFLLITTGSDRRKLTDVEGADVFEHKGLTYCATCDGPLFKDKDVVVIGGGNAGFETAAQLLAYCKSVTLLNRGSQYKADKITVEKVLQDSKMTAITNANIKKIFGEVLVKGIIYEKDGIDVELPVEGVFVEIGILPNTDLFKNLVDVDKYNRIIVDPHYQRTSHNKIWAAGDCTDAKFHQNNIATGDAVKAIEDIYLKSKTT